MAIDIGQMFEATKDGMQLMSGEDPKVEVNKLSWKNGSPKKNGSSKKKHDQVQTCDGCGYNAHKPQEKCSDYIFCRVIYLLPINLFLISCQMHNSFYF